ncbi:MAG TPA: hypothetical protein PKH08_05275 [Clostridia bacterium]|nr:hypothetical protein [Clostridia bacterium]
MRKILEKIVSIALTVIGLLFIALLLVVMFGAVGVDELDNQVVKALVIALTGVFVVLAAIMIAASFADNDKLNSILLFKDKESATKAAVTVVKSLVKKASKRVEQAKVTKVVLFGDENNNVRLVVYIKIKGNDTEAVINRVRAEIEATCDKVLEYRFAAIDFRITLVKADYKPSDSEIDAKVAAFKKEKELAERAKAEALPSEVTGVEEAPAAEEATISELVVAVEAAPADEAVAEEVTAAADEAPAETEAVEAEVDAETQVAADTEILPAEEVAPAEEITEAPEAAADEAPAETEEIVDAADANEEKAEE